MSPDVLRVATSVARVEEAPLGARLVEGDLRAALDRRIASVRAEAHAAGVRDGVRAASEAAAARLDEAAEALAAQRLEAEGAVSGLAVELAIEIASALVRREVNAGNHAVETIVREALASAETGRAACKVHVHPTDAAALAGVTFRSGTEICSDEGVQRGSVHVETERGLLVRDSGELLERIGRRLREEAG